MLQLIKNKPFECVGTKEESLLAFYLSFEKAKEKYPQLKDIQIQDLIEAAVYIVKEKSKNIQDKFEEME